MNEKNYSRLTGRANGVVSTGNTVEIPYHWHPVFKHLKITKITVAPFYKDIPRLIALPTIFENILQKQQIDIKKYFDRHIFLSVEYQPNDLKKMLRESIDVDIDENNTAKIPKELLRKAGISRNIIFIGMLSYFEIWDPEYLSKEKIKDMDYINKILSGQS